MEFQNIIDNCLYVLKTIEEDEDRLSDFEMKNFLNNIIKELRGEFK